MKSFAATIFIVSLFFLPAQKVLGQDFFLITGKLKAQTGKLNGAKIIVEKDGAVQRTKSVEKSGKFEFELDFNSTYILSFVQEGYVTKKMSFETTVPAERIANGFYPFDFQITIFQQFDDISTVIFDQPVGQITYNSEYGDFDYDKDYTQSILRQMQEVEKKIEKRVEEEEKLEKKKEKQQKPEKKEEPPVAKKEPEPQQEVRSVPAKSTPVKPPKKNEYKQIRKSISANMVVLQAYTVGEFNYPNLSAYGYINFGDGGGNREISKDEFDKYAKEYR